MILRARNPRLNALMRPVGNYDGSGDFAYRSGVPAKSGVGGASLPLIRRAAIAVGRRASTVMAIRKSTQLGGSPAKWAESIF